MALTYGFGGMRDYDGKLSFDPRLPKAWNLLRFRIRFHDSRLEVEVTDETFSITLLEGDPLDVTILGTEYTVAKDHTVTVGFGT